MSDWKDLGECWRFVAVTVAAAGVGCGNEEQAEGPEPRPVITITVPDLEEGSGRVFSGLAKSAVGGGISFEVSGRVTAVAAKSGEIYKVGDELARVDPVEYLNQLANARAQLTEAEQSWSQTKRLFEIQNATQPQLDTAEAKRDALAAQFASAQKKVDDCVLRMPYEGVMGSVDLDEQTVVRAGQIVMRIQKSGNVEFEAGLPASVVGQVSVGMSGMVSLGAIKNMNWDAEVISVSPQVSENTTYPVTLRILGDTSEIRDGMDGEVDLRLVNGNGGVLFLPSECVFGGVLGDQQDAGDQPESGARQYVWVFAAAEENPSEGIVERRVVEVTGGIGAGGTIGVKSAAGDGTGVKPGERIISRGVGTVDQGQKVRLKGE